MAYRLAVACLAQLTISASLLTWAALTHGAAPRWAGVADVLLAFTIVGTALVFRTRAVHRRAIGISSAYVVATTLVPAVTVALWWFRGRLDFNILLPGLAWRSFILLELMPGLFAMVANRGHSASSNPACDGARS